jgi:hypothetical protein
MGLVLLLLQLLELFSLLQGLGFKALESVGFGVRGVATWRVSTIRLVGWRFRDEEEGVENSE